MPRKAARDIDAAKRARVLTAAAWSLAGGAIGAFAGAFIGIGILFGFAIGFTFSLVVSLLVVEGVGHVMGVIHNPSGKSTPVVREYSYPESLAIRGRYEDAIDAYQVCCTDYPDDPEPYVRIARIYRDNLGQFEEAILWFKRARSEAAVSKGQELLASQEIIEIYTGKLNLPERAIPELARLAEKYAGEPAGDTAKHELARLREGLGERT
jgi:tetratricopeptide (TPR) repeat protein